MGFVFRVQKLKIYRVLCSVSEDVFILFGLTGLVYENVFFIFWVLCFVSEDVFNFFRVTRIFYTFPKTFLLPVLNTTATCNPESRFRVRQYQGQTGSFSVVRKVTFLAAQNCFLWIQFFDHPTPSENKINIDYRIFEVLLFGVFRNSFAVP